VLFYVCVPYNKAKGKNSQQELGNVHRALQRWHVRSILFNTRNLQHRNTCGPGSSVGIATDYGLNGPGIESRWGRDFSYTSRPALGPTQPPVQWVPGFFLSVVKQPERGADHPPPSSAEVENEYS
jgi:hypothetical protein